MWLTRVSPVLRLPGVGGFPPFVDWHSLLGFMGAAARDRLHPKWGVPSIHPLSYLHEAGGGPFGSSPVLTRCGVEEALDFLPK